MSSHRPIRVFLVDDVPELRMLVRLTLTEDPDIVVVGEAENGRAGVDGVAHAQPDVVLLDLSMPDMDGLEAIPQMRELAPGARLVVLSGHEAGRVSLEALEQGATRYLSKAADLETIRAVVREVAEFEPPFSDPRFGTVRTMWEKFLNGEIDSMLADAEADATWRPYTAGGRTFHSHDELRDYIRRLLAEGRIIDPRAYGVEPRGGGMLVFGTLEIRGPSGMSETEVYWAFCFRGDRIAMAGGYARRDEALATLAASCPS